MASGKFIDIPLKVLRTHAVVGSIVSPLQQCPKGFNAVGVDLSLNVFPNGMLDDFMIGQALVGSMVIGIDGRSFFRLTQDETMKLFLDCDSSLFNEVMKM